MPDHSNVAFTFVKELARSSGASDVTAAMQRALGPFGLEFFSFFNFPRTGEILEDVRVAIRMPFELQKIIHREQYLRVSPAVRHCQRTVQPFAWNAAPYDPVREPRAAAFVDVMTAFGLESGVTVPILSPTGCNGMAWLAGQRQEVTARNLQMIHFIALYEFDRIRSLAGRKPGTVANLTPREREALTWATLGKSAWEIGEILCIAKRTVDEHTQTAMRKLGAINRAQAVAIAIRCRLIDPFGE